MNLVYETLRQVVNQYGNDILRDSRRCRAILADLIPGNKTEIALLGIALSEGAGAKLIDAYNSGAISKDAAIKQTVDMLVDRVSMDRGKAELAVCYFAYAIGWDISTQINGNAKSTGNSQSVISQSSSQFSGFTQKSNISNDLLTAATKIKSTPQTGGAQSSTNTQTSPPIYTTSTRRPKKKKRGRIVILLLIALVGGVSFISTQTEIPWVTDKVEIVIDKTIHLYEIAMNNIHSDDAQSHEKSSTNNRTEISPADNSTSISTKEAGTVTTTGDVNVRSGPGINYNKLSVIYNGTKLKYAGESSTDSRGVTWYKVKLPDNSYGWISSAYSEFSETGLGENCSDPDSVDWSVSYKTVMSQGNTDADKATVISEDLIGKVLQVQDQAGGWFKLIAPKDGDYVFHVLSPNLSNDTFSMSFSLDGSHVGSIQFRRSNTEQKGLLKGITKGTVITWWDNDDSGRYWTLKDPFKLMITIQ